MLELGASRSEELLEISKSFVLRRTADLLSNYLPPKSVYPALKLSRFGLTYHISLAEYVIFVKPTALQLSIFQKILNPKTMDDVEHGPAIKSLALINTLGKICNSPYLLKKDGTKSADKVDPSVKGALSLLPPDVQAEDFSLSGEWKRSHYLLCTYVSQIGKLIFLGRLLRHMRKVSTI